VASTRDGEDNGEGSSARRDRRRRGATGREMRRQWRDGVGERAGAAVSASARRGISRGEGSREGEAVRGARAGERWKGRERD
jgi:hypothetical protein